MERTSGRPEIVIALIDGPVLMQNAALWSKNVRQLNGKLPTTCEQASSSACMHGTFVASILAAKRGSGAPAICPDCTLLVRPIFSEASQYGVQIPSATAGELAEAIVDAVNAGASILNLSVSLADSSAHGKTQLEQALNYAAARDVVTVVAAGNQGMIGNSVLTSHPWAIPVIACDDSGRPLVTSNLSASTGHNGLGAPGENLPVIGPGDAISRISGTSAAAPFVAGTAALLRSAFSRATATAIKTALTHRKMGQRRRLIPPLLDAWAAYQLLAGTA